MIGLVITLVHNSDERRFQTTSTGFNRNLCFSPANISLPPPLLRAIGYQVRLVVCTMVLRPVYVVSMMDKANGRSKCTRCNHVTGTTCANRRPFKYSIKNLASRNLLDTTYPNYSVDSSLSMLLVVGFFVPFFYTTNDGTKKTFSSN